MFDVGFGEVILILVAGAVMLDFKDLPVIFRFIRKLINYCRDLSKEFRDIFNDIEEDTTKIIDLDGNIQKAYDHKQIENKLRSKNRDI